MKALLFLLLATVSTLAQFGGESIRPWEPRDIRTKAGLFAQYDVGQASTVTLNGSGISKVTDKSWVPGRLENLLVQSEALSTTWTTNKINPFGAVDTGAAGAGSFANTARTTDPLGGNTADFLQEDATAGIAHMMAQAISTTLNSGSTVTLSVYAKAAGRNWTRMSCSGASAFFAGYFQLTGAGAVGTTASSGDTVSATISTAGLPAGWYLCSLTSTLSTTETRSVYLRICTADNTPTHDGDNTSGLFLWGAQLRRATSSSTYVATTTVAEDASRDLLQSTAANQPLVSRADNKGNLLVQSEAFSTTWSRAQANAFGAVDTGATGAGSFANTSRTTDPLSGNTADFLQQDATAFSVHEVYQNLTLSPGIYVFSSWVKADAASYVALAELWNSSHRGFNLNNGTSYAVPYTVDAGAGNSSITASVNGWYLCSLTFNVTSQSTHGVYLIILKDGSTRPEYDGDNTSGLFLWGASLRSSTWDSDYIATGATIAVPGLNGKTTAYFDGSAHYLKTAGMASLVQPETVVMVGKQVTWTATDRIFDGSVFNASGFYQHPTTPQVRMYAGSAEVANNSNLAVGAWGVAHVVFNGASSSIQINQTATTTGNPGASNMAGLTLGADGGGTEPGNIQVQHFLLFNQVLATPELNYVKYGGLRDVGALP